MGVEYFAQVVAPIINAFAALMHRAAIPGKYIGGEVRLTPRNSAVGEQFT
jgi:hypothetical protein